MIGLSLLFIGFAAGLLSADWLGHATRRQEAIAQAELDEQTKGGLRTW